MKKIEVLLVDDQEILREGIKSLLGVNEDINIIAQASNGKEAYEKALAHNPDLILMDIRMPTMDGVEATRIIKETNPNIKILILTTFDDDEYIIKAINYGASGYLLKDIDAQKLAQAIRDAVAGNVILPGIVAAKITSMLAMQNSSNNLDNKNSNNTNISQNDFKDREIDVIKLLVQGKNNKEISSELFLTVGTVKNYISQIYLKTGVNDRANAVLELKKLGF